MRSQVGGKATESTQLIKEFFMYYQLHCEYPNGNIQVKKMSTTLDSAERWAREMNQLYPQIRHWVEEVLYQGNVR